MKKTICIAAAIIFSFVIAIFAVSGDDIKKGIRNPQFQSSLTAVPEVISYQGVLTDSEGAPLDTTVDITFTIYSGEEQLWSEPHSSVAIEGGLFNVLLGSITPIQPDLFSGGETYLGVKVGDDDEMTPWQRIASTPYAFDVHGLDVDAEGKVGIGTTEPSYTLHVDGTAYSTGDWEGSDLRLKKNVENLTGVVERLKNVNGVKFDWRCDEFPDRGLPEVRQIGLVG